MATSLVMLFATEEPPLTPREALSGIFGSISLACWIFLLVPQLVENYRNSSAEAISLAFLFVWFLGDICNLAGALWAGLVPVVVAIGVYFCIADGVLIGQCLYYGIKNKRREHKALLAATPSGSNGVAERTARAPEEEPLLKRSRTNSITIPGSGERRRSSASLRRRRSSAAHTDQLVKILEESDETGRRFWFKDVISVVAIIAVGAIGWTIAYETGAWKPTPESTDGEVEKTAAGAQVLGYLSAIAYLGARIPQILKNARDKSCEGMWTNSPASSILGLVHAPHCVPLPTVADHSCTGLSLLFFILSLLGNLTYGAGILFHSTQKEYFVRNLPWLIGSLGTVVEDITIFAQFHMYRNAGGDEAVV